MICVPRLLKQAPRELFFVFFLKLFGSLVYFATSVIFVIYLHREFAFDDVHSRLVFGASGALTSVAGVACGPLIDKVRIRTALVCGFLLSSCGLALLGLAQSAFWVYVAALIVLPISSSLGVPVLTIGIDRYTSARNRSLAYGIFYSMMNVGALLAGGSVDAVRSLDLGGYEVRGHKITYMRVVFLLGSAISAFLAVIAALSIRFVHVTKHGEVREGARPDEPTAANKPTCIQALWDRTFWRMVFLSIALTPVNMVFRHMDTTLPQYLLRTIGETVDFGLLYSVDPFVVIILSIVFPLLFNRYDVYSRMIVGAFIASLSVFILASHATIVSAAAFGVVLAIGESLYSPLVYSYTMALAPTGHEATYAALSTAPLFSTNLFVAFLSGKLMMQYCPENEAHDQCPLVWVIVGCVSLISPFLLLSLKRFVHTNDVRLRLAVQRDGATRDDNDDRDAADILLDVMVDKLES